MRIRYFRYSLRSLLLVFTFAAIYLGLEANRVAKQREALDIIQAVGGIVIYDYEFDAQGKLRRKPNRLSPPGSPWLHSLLGKDYFRTVVHLQLSDTIVGDNELGQLSNLLPHVLSVWLSKTQITNDGLSYIPNFKKLEKLSLQETDVNDDGMRFVSKCTWLRNLQLTRTKVTDAGLKHLTTLRNLEKIGLSSTGVSDEGIECVLTASPEKLRWLNLQHTKTTDTIVGRLMLLPTLDFVNVKDTGVSVEGALKVREAFPNCRVIHASSKYLSGGSLFTNFAPGPSPFQHANSQPRSSGSVPNGVKVGAEPEGRLD